MKKRVLALMLVAIMVLSTAFTGCAKKTDDSSSTSTETKQQETKKDDTKKEETKSGASADVSAEPITISVASYMYGPIENDVITPLIEQKLLEDHGINVKIEVVYVEQSEYSEIINTRIAGDTAPDVFLASSKSNLETYYDQGAIAYWSEEFFRENAPDVWDFIMGGAAYGDLADQTDAWLQEAFIDGNMVTVPSFKPDGSMPYKTLIYRGDFLDAVGVSRDNLPKTVDEFVDLMYKFAKEDPDGNGKDDTYGMSITGMKALFGAYGIYSGFSGGSSYWYEKDGKVYNADISDQAKEALTILAQMYKDGVIDPEFSSGTESISGSYWAISNGFVNGRYGASALASIDHYRLKEVLGDGGGNVATEYWAVNGEDSEFVYGPWPMGPDGEYGYAVGEAVSVIESAVYNANLMDDMDKLAVIFQIMNAFAVDDDLMMLAKYGIEGEHYTISDAGTVVMNEGIGTLEMNAMGIAVARSLYGADRAYSEKSYDLAFYKDKSIENRLNWFKKDQYDSHIHDAVTVTLPSSADYSGELTTLRDETYVDIITGKKSIDDWDEYVNTYMSYGGQILFDEANDWYANR